ncbi:hypothetical protein J7F01_16905 [Streptomyces sp. ISL-22]|uniref:hypothetical protein n=1 Tax=unclassified Streptomyces TaxID=2593676 RepID=UPI001BE86EE5|nr:MULTISPECIES: hypothetical protein [unclassified Streptomyces]MBT2424016.1 hypothetical protein [Streptomyces sp. ISL-24]MBT2433829.1 hypothetical protein [Streptomyces sp. ISL-22]
MKSSLGMRTRLSERRRRFAGILAGGIITVPATLGLTACDSAQDALDRGDMCLNILDIALFDPNPSSADEARKDVRERADKIDEIAEKASDDKLRDAAEQTAKELRDAADDDLDAGSVSEYVSQQNDRLKALRKTCTDLGDFG